MRYRASTVLLMALSITSTAFPQWREDGKVVPDRPWAKSAGDFGAKLMLTDKPDELFAAWEKKGPAVLMSETESTKRGVPIVAVVFFTGCTANKRGMCEATVRFTAYTPDGKAWGKPQEGELWVNKPPPPKDQIQLSIGNMGLVIDPDDPLGVYRVQAEIV